MRTKAWKLLPTTMQVRQKLKTSALLALTCPAWSFPPLPLGVHGTVSISGTDYLSLSLWRAERGITESSKRQSDRLVPMKWHSLHGGRTWSRYWWWGNKLWTRGDDDKLSHPEGDGKCHKAGLEHGKMWAWSSLRVNELPLLIPDCRISSVSPLAESQELPSTITDIEKHLVPRELSGVGESTISSACLFWLLISCHWLEVYNLFPSWICL